LHIIDTILPYRGMPLGWGAGWVVTRKLGWGSFLGLKSQRIGIGL